VTKNIKLIENIDLDEFKNNLKSSRESKNITIEEAAKTLHVSVVILKNLENGELDKLANDVFTIGHIRTYLKWLGINPYLIIGDFKNVQNTELKSKNLKINVPYGFKLSKFTASLISLILFILIILIYKNLNKAEQLPYVSTSNIQDSLKEDKITNLKVKNAPEINNTSKEDLDEESKIKSMPENVALENNYIHIKAIEDTWIEIQRNNSEVLITKIIKKDEKIKIPYEKDLILVTGNAGSIIIHINGKTINNIGMPGEVKRNISLNYDDLIKFLNN
jgi:transcriptional regulator with XRE-family HTH domain